MAEKSLLEDREVRHLVTWINAEVSTKVDAEFGDNILENYCIPFAFVVHLK